VLECVVNVAEGRTREVVLELARAAGEALLDVHRDADHNRSVLTLAGPRVEEATWALARRVAELVDVRGHEGVHPWLGALDVVPFVPLEGSSFEEAIGARDRCAVQLADELAIPVFLYGPERSLPYVRRHAFDDLAPDRGPSRPHPRLGASCVGARGVLVAYNVVVAAPLAQAREVARRLRSPNVRTLAFQAGARVQVSANLIDPVAVGPATFVDLVRQQVDVVGCELVGLVPAWVLEATPPERWRELDLGPDRTIEERLSHGYALDRVP
jgi:glutamate formiminotransferase